MTTLSQSILWFRSFVDALRHINEGIITMSIMLYVAECFKERTDVQCLHRWQKVLNPELVKGPWSKEVRQ